MLHDQLVFDDLNVPKTTLLKLLFYGLCRIPIIGCYNPYIYVFVHPVDFKFALLAHNSSLLHGHCDNCTVKGKAAMMTLGIALLLVAAFFAEWYELMFWVAAIVALNGAMAIVWAVINPEWYWRKREQAGLSDGPLDSVIHGERSFIPGMLLVKIPLITLLVAAAWFGGIRAGYL